MCRQAVGARVGQGGRRGPVAARYVFLRRRLGNLFARRTKPESAISVPPIPKASSHQLLMRSRCVQSMMWSPHTKSKKRHVSLRAASTAPVEASI